MPQTDLNTSTDMKEKIDSFRKSVSGGNVKKTGPIYFGIALAVACDLLAGLIVGGLIGYVLYSYFHLHLLVFGLFIFLGGLAGVVNVFKTLSKLSKEEKENAA